MTFSFKAMVEADRRRTFLNLDEFGEKHTVEGKAIAAVLDDNALKLDDQTILVADIQSSFLRQHSMTRGVWTLTIWTKTPQRLAGVAEDLPARRPAGEGLNVDGREYIVNDWSEDMGIATVALGQTVTM